MSLHEKCHRKTQEPQDDPTNKGHIKLLPQWHNHGQLKRGHLPVPPPLSALHQTYMMHRLLPRISTAPCVEPFQRPSALKPQLVLRDSSQMSGPITSATPLFPAPRLDLRQSPAPQGLRCDRPARGPCDLHAAAAAQETLRRGQEGLSVVLGVAHLQGETGEPIDGSRRMGWGLSRARAQCCTRPNKYESSSHGMQGFPFRGQTPAPQDSFSPGSTLLCCPAHQRGASGGASSESHPPGESLILPHAC